MANPSAYYQWVFPDETEDNWYDKFHAGLAQMDASVVSVSGLFPIIGKTVVVVSFVAPTEPAIFAANQVTYPAGALNDATWTYRAMSTAPVGNVGGTVTIAYSGAVVRFDVLFQDQTLGADSQAIRTYAVTHTQWRLVTAGTSISISGDSFWRAVHRGFGHPQPLWFTALASLGIGTHTVTLETRAVTHARATPSTLSTSGHHFVPRGPVVILATFESV